MPDSSKWVYETGFRRNHELQWYLPGNAICSNGNLVITGKRDTFPNPGYNPDAPDEDWEHSRKMVYYTSASLNTYGKGSWAYGHFEVRAKLPFEWGAWPAIWTLGVGDGIPPVGPSWPACGEIDIMEMYPVNEQQALLANVMDATENWSVKTKSINDYIAGDPDWKDKFHVWTMDWSSDSIILSVDSSRLNAVAIADLPSPKPFYGPHFFLLNLAIGSNGGDPGGSNLPMHYEIDYVRIYQKEEDISGR